MKALIATHVLLWGLQSEEKLSPQVQTLLPKSDLWISVASLWEIITKVQVGKLDLPKPVGDYLSKKLESQRSSGSPNHIRPREAAGRITAASPRPIRPHADSQNIEENLPVITADPLFKQYPVQVLW